MFEIECQGELTTPLRADFSSVRSDIIITNTASQAHTQMHTDRK